MHEKSLIQPGFTTTFQVKYCLVLAGGSLLTSLFLYIYLDRSLGGNYFECLRTLSHLSQALPLTLLLTFAVQLIAIFILTIGIHLFVSHKIAGPVYRYELFLNDLRKGDLRYQVRTRDGDQLKTMVTSLNTLAASLKDVYGAAQSLQTGLDDLWGRPAEERAANFTQLHNQIAQLRGFLSEPPPVPEKNRP